MTIFQAAILSIVEGLTEFLPISSTGHLILAANLLKIPQTEFVKSFEIFIQLGAILAVVVLYSQTLLQNLAVWKRILTAFIPTAILGFIFYKLVKQYLIGNSIITLLSLFFGGVILILLEKIYRERIHQDKIEDLSSARAFFIGIFQSISMIPGISRAAATIFGGLYLGLDRKTAVEFSFLLAIPTMLAATFLDLVKSGFNFTQEEFTLLVIGFTGSFFTALVAVRYFLQYIKRHNFIPFGIYRMALATLFWLVQTS